MFSLGLEFTFPKLARVGKTAVGTSLLEVFLMVAIGFITGQSLGWTQSDSIFLGGILSISSTTIIIKAFNELGVKTRRYAELVFGVLVVEDLVAILLLVGLTTVSATHSLFSMALLISAIKLVVIVGSWFIFGYFLIPSFVRYVGKFLDNETLTVLCTALCLFLVTLATHFNYSAALGAFIMGSILAETTESRRIESLVEPLKDLFAAVFFVSVGMLVDPEILLTHWKPILLISLITIIGKILSTALGALSTGQPLRRSIQMGFSLAQIGEFSFIIATLGSTLGVTSSFLFPIAVSVSVITTFTTPYLIRFSEPFANFLEKKLPPSWVRRIEIYSAWTERKAAQTERKNRSKKHALQFLINTILVTLILLGLKGFYPQSLGNLIYAWIVSVALCSPFIWGMFFAFPIGTFIWLPLISSIYFPNLGSLTMAFAIASLVFFIFYRKLEKAYRWFEGKFLANLKDNEELAEKEALSTLAPWDVHTVRIVIHQNSRLVGKAIKEHQIRKNYQLTIVAIQRGLKVIASPTADEILFPRDELLVIGTDESMERFRLLAEEPSGDKGDGKNLTDYSLKQLLIDGESPFVGKSIQESGLRESLNGLIVGLERGNLRTVNPDPTMTLQVGDLLWLVSA
jgi:CPA2 family monovalent cation:H+ antiporter-2